MRSPSNLRQTNHQQVGESGDFRCEDHYEAALHNADALLANPDIRSIQYLVLLALYCLRGPKSVRSWTLAGLAVRLCIELGLHRGSTDTKITMENEIRKRVFWSCYHLDRGVSVALGEMGFVPSSDMCLTAVGRPPAISDDDIEVEVVPVVAYNQECCLTSLSIRLMSMSRLMIQLYFAKSRRKDSHLPASHPPL